MSRGSKQHKSSDGVPNRKGGSWPNHPSMRYELPIPFSPGADNVTDSYRDGWDRVFGAKNDPIAKLEPVSEPMTCTRARPGFCPGHLPGEAECRHAFGDWPAPYVTPDMMAPVGIIASTPCEVCGEMGAYHRVDRGVFTCEIES